MKNILSVLSCVVLAAGCSCKAPQQPLAQSPDGRNQIRLYDNPFSYEVLRDGVVVVSRSALALHLSGETLTSSGKTARVSCGAYGGKEDSAIYKKARIDLAGNWAFADYGDWGVRLVARNDGVAYRFETRKPGKVKVVNETANLTIPDPQASCWVTFTSLAGAEETVPEAHAAKDVKTQPKKDFIYLPFVYRVGGKTVAVTESDVFDYPIWNMKRAEAGTAPFEGIFPAFPKKTVHVQNVGGWNDRREVAKGGRWICAKENEDYLVETAGTRTFPWRTFVLSDEPAALCQADTVRALARPAQKQDDFSWVRPGKVAWDWWNAFDNKGDPKGCTTETYVRFIDFAAKNGVEYVIFDEGWSANLDIWTFSPKVDVPYLIDYANKKGVGIILWLAWAQVYGDEERVAAHFAKLGAKGFKVDFMDRGDAACTRFLWKFAEACSKHKMLVDYHGVYRPTGLSRAYPNVLNYEGVHGLECMKWFRNNYDFMANDVRAFFLRMTAGPLDYTPGAMDNYPIGAYKGDNTNPGSVGTRCRQMAMMALYEAPLQMLCDSPTKYEKNMACFAFMAATPVVWQDTVGLGGCPESYAAVARQAPDGAWYVAAIGNAKAHDVTIDTARFLAAGDWRVEIFRDDVSAASAQAYLHETRTLKAGEKMTVPMACGGGFVMKFAK